MEQLAALANAQHQNAVLYVPPLRVVAPPGVPPRLPQAFDPFFFILNSRSDIFRHNGAGPSTAPPPPTPPVPTFQAERPMDDAIAENGAASSNFAPRIATFSTLGARFGWETRSSRIDSCIEGRRTWKAVDDPEKTPEADKVKEECVAAGNEGSDIPIAAGFVQMDSLNGQQHMASTKFEHSHQKKRRKKMDISSSQKLQIIKKPTTSEHSNQKKPKRKSKSSNRRSLKIRGMAGPVNISPHEAVINTLRLYDALRRNLLLEEESKHKDASKGSRPDLQAGSIIQDNGLMVNRIKKFVGSVPGIEIGDQFYFRMELCIVGMHGPIQGGIEYLTTKESEFNAPVATSIISSGGYDATDTGEELLYTGQGGKSAQDRKFIEDQKLERGNLALENSMKHHIPVRVTRGIKDSTSPSGKTYTYDGLYKVEACWSEKGKFGFEEYKFKLCRLPGQPHLGSANLNLSHTLKYKPNNREGLLLQDVAGGKEGMPICVVNMVDDLKGPSPFEYTTSLQYPQGANYEQYGPSQGCNCTGVCDASQACSCFLKNGDAFAYLNGGLLVKERGAIYECGSNCLCSFGCRNRTTQKALKFRLEVFKTEDRGWGLRSWDSIPAGSFISEFTGKLMQPTQLPLTGDYVLDVRRLPRVSLSWGDVSSLLNTLSSRASVSASLTDFIVDSSQIGNAMRFINHSCSPNVFVQPVLRDHQDTKRPHLMLFAMDNIPPFKELTRNYGFDSNLGELGKHCLCKAENCKQKFYE